MIGVVVLGSTGSIGESTLDVLARHPERFRLIGIGANRSVEKLTTQILKYRPAYAALADPAAARELAARLGDAAPDTRLLAGLCALVPAWLALARLRLGGPRGAEWVLFCLLLVWMADIGAYFAGRRFGRRRLAPEVSPGKTWEGVLGGVAACIPVAVGGSFWFSVPLGGFLVLCLAAVACSIVGDLTESLLKRFAGVKDSGTLFPGHGGVMDRIDSLTAAAPVLLLGLTVLGVLA